MTADQSHSVAQALGDLARQLATVRDVDARLDAIVQSALQTVAGASGVGISYLDGRVVTARAQTDDLITEVDDLQTRLQEGPCHQVLTAGTNSLRVDDFIADDRWPTFAAAASERGVVSALSYRLFLGEETLGVLTFFASTPNAFDSASEVIGELFATHAAVALGGTRKAGQLSIAIRNRDVIGQAKGILMAQHGLDEEQAFATLVRFSQTEHVKLYHVAERLIASLSAKPYPE